RVHLVVELLPRSLRHAQQRVLSHVRHVGVLPLFVGGGRLPRAPHRVRGASCPAAAARREVQAPATTERHAVAARASIPAATVNRPRIAPTPMRSLAKARSPFTARNAERARHRAARPAIASTQVMTPPPAACRR